MTTNITIEPLRVREVITRLQELDPDMRVWLSDEPLVLDDIRRVFDRVVIGDGKAKERIEDLEYQLRQFRDLLQEMLARYSED